MPAPRNPSRRGTSGSSTSSASSTSATSSTGSARSGTKLRRGHAEPPKSPVPFIAAIAGGVAVLAIAVFLFKRGDDEPVDHAAAIAAAAEAESAAAAAAVEEAAAKAAAAAAAIPTPPPAPKEPPLPDRETLRRQVRTAASAAEAATLAIDADRLKDEKLSEECWTRVFQLDADHPQARAKLDVRKLAPADDLEGFSDVARTPQKVALQSFYDEASQELTRSGRAEVVKRWNEVRPALEERAAKGKSDPFFKAIDALRGTLVERPFFAKLEYEMVESRPPYALFVEVAGTPAEREKRRAAVEAGYSPYLEAFDKRIRSYLLPLTPKPPAEDPFLPVFIFLNEKRYQDYQVEDHGGRGSPGMRAHYEPWSKQSFTWTTVIKPGLGAFESGVQTLLHELTHAWIDRLASSDGGESCAIGELNTHWFSEGIAEYMSYHFRDGEMIKFQPWRSGRLAETGRTAKLRVGLKRALAMPLHGLNAVAATMVGDVEGEQRDGLISTISSGFYADMSNFILWLNFPAGANRAAQWKEYAKAELFGEGGDAAFKRCFPGLLEQGAELDAIVDEFVKQIAGGKINAYKEVQKAGSDF